MDLNLDSFLKEIHERQERYHTLVPQSDSITGISTHFIELDKLINGLEKSQLIVLDGRPAMGKTDLALNIAQNICFNSNRTVGFFSSEMPYSQILQ